MTENTQKFLHNVEKSKIQVLLQNCWIYNSKNYCRNQLKLDCQMHFTLSNGNNKVKSKIWKLNMLLNKTTFKIVKKNTDNN